MRAQFNMPTQDHLDRIAAAAKALEDALNSGKADCSIKVGVEYGRHTLRDGPDCQASYAVSVGVQTFDYVYVAGAPSSAPPLR